MQRIEHLLALAVGSVVLGHQLTVAADLDAIDVGPDRDRGEGMPPRDAVAVLLPGDRLVLVDLADLAHRGVERAPGQRQGAGPLVGEAGADCFALARNRPLPVPLATPKQVRVELRQIVHSRNRRRPLALQQLHPVLDVRLLIASGRQAEQGLEVVVISQRLPTLVQFSLATGQDRRRDRLRVIPPQFSGRAAEERQGLDRAVQDRLGLFARQRHHERGVRVGPGHHQDRRLAPSLREVDPDVAEVALGPLARLVGERQERLAPPAAPRSDVSPHLVVAAEVTFFIPQPTKKLRRQMTLLGRRLLVRGQNRVDPLLVDFGQHPPRTRPAERVRLGFRRLKRLPDLSPGMAEGPGNLANAHPIPVCTTYPAVVFHLQHPRLRFARRPSLKTGMPAYEVRCGGPEFNADLAGGVGPVSMPMSIRTRHCSDDPTPKAIHQVYSA